MSIDKVDIYVYAHWQGMKEPKPIGILSSRRGKGRKSFSFEYDRNWIQSESQFLLDPHIQWFQGAQYPYRAENFGVFLDSMPDTWGRTLMKRRAAQQARENNKPAPNLYDIDFLLGVYDPCRMGALRFKRIPDGPFLDDNDMYPTPPWSSIRDVQYAADQLETNMNEDEISNWLAILMAPGSSLGGARPKANILDEHNHLWIAKFPSKNDVIDKGLWEYLVYSLAIESGIHMAESKVACVSGHHHTFFTRRFDRYNQERIHFACAMTMTGHSEESIRDQPASYLDIAEFIQFSGTNNQNDLAQLWRRIVFNIAISNTDDHLRNHGFILTTNGWRLSPAFDLNASIDKQGLALNIDEKSNALDFELVKQVGSYFQLSDTQMSHILDEVKTTVSTWKRVAQQLGIPRQEQQLMQNAFRFDL